MEIAGYLVLIFYLQICTKDMWSYKQAVVLKCDDKEITQKLLNADKRVKRLSGPQPSVFNAKLMVWIDHNHLIKEENIKRFEENEVLYLILLVLQDSLFNHV